MKWSHSRFEQTRLDLDVIQWSHRWVSTHNTDRHFVLRPNVCVMKHVGAKLLPPEDRGWCESILELLKVQPGLCGRFDWERFASGEFALPPSTPRWAEGDSQHSSSCHGRSTAPERREAPSSGFKLWAPAHREAIKLSGDDTRADF